jgi:hypothetical protein
MVYPTNFNEAAMGTSPQKIIRPMKRKPSHLTALFESAWNRGRFAIPLAMC